MAFGKSSKMDSRRSSSSSYCSTVTLVVFVALCLVGVWMMTSTSMAPVDVSTIENKSEVQEESTSEVEKPFEDGSGDVTEDAGKGDSDGNSETPSDESPTEDSQGQTATDKVNEIKEQETHEETVVKEDVSKKESEGQSFSDENGKAEGGESTKDNEASTDDNRDEGTGVGNEEVKLSEQSKGTDDDSGGETLQEGKGQEQEEQGVEEPELQASDSKSELVSKEVFPDPAQSELLNETNTQTGSFSTQASESKKEKELQKSSNGQNVGYSWKLCNVSAGADYIPCLDNEDAIRKLPTTKHYEHRERHCPAESPTCLVQLPEGYKQPMTWPDSRDKIWYANVPHTKLAEVKGHQNWVKATGEFLTFPGGGTQFKYGALHYIDFIQESCSDVAWGRQTRVILDVGCGVASFGGYLFERDVLTMSFAPKDEHEAQVQFALERGIPAISAVMGTKRLPFPSIVFDAIHCARCRVPWHIEGGKLLLELNRLLRPGGYFMWSATPIYQKLPEDVEIWQAMSELTKSMCWEMVSMTKDEVNHVGIAIYKKPSTNECYEQRVENSPPMCKKSDDPNAAWNILLQDCMHRVPMETGIRGSRWPDQWPERLETPPYWLNSSQVGVYGKAAPDDFKADYEHWKHIVSKSYVNGMGIDWSKVRNVMDMRAIYGGFAAALRDMNVWVMNVVSIDSADTLPIIYERGLFGIYHDWCESFSTYPRTFDLLHADHLFSRIKKRCSLQSAMAEVDRILRPKGKVIVRDNVEMITEVEALARSLQWEIRMTYSKEKEGLLCIQKTSWRPQDYDVSM